MYTVCVSPGVFVLLLPHHDNWRDCDCVCLCVCMSVCECMTVCVSVGCGERLTHHINTHALTHMQTCMWVVGVFCPSSPCFVKRGTGTLFDLKSIIMHLNNLACVWTNCVGMICQNWIMLNMHFCVHLKTAELKKTVMSNLFIVVSVLLENPVFRCTLYIQCCTLQRYTLFLVQYCTVIAIVV